MGLAKVWQDNLTSTNQKVGLQFKQLIKLIKWNNSLNAELIISIVA